MNNQAIKCKLCGEDFVRSYHSRKYCDSCNDGRIIENRYGYHLIFKSGKFEPLHRVVYESVYGEIPDGYVVHHIDGDRGNNDIGNLLALPMPDHIALHHKARIHTQPKRKEGRTMKPELLSTKDAAKILNVSPMTVRNYCRQGVIEAFKVHRDWRIVNRAEWWLNLKKDNGHKKGE